MAQPLSVLLEKVSPEVKAAATIKAAHMLTLKELREACGVTQTNLAEVLGIQQPNVAQLEKREDVYLSTLRRYLEALGATLEVVARFPDGSRVIIEQDIDEPVEVE